MKKMSLVSLILVLLTGSCASTKQFRYMSKAKAPKGTFREEIPFELHNDLIVLKVKLTGSDKEFEFMLDTGAPVSVIYTEAMEATKATTVLSFGIADSQGNSTKSNYVFLDMQIGGLTFKDVYTAYSPQSSEPITCIAKGGIIGADLMQTANWHIDFERKVLVISDRKKSSLPDLKAYQKIAFTKRSPISSMPWFNILPGLTLDLTVNGVLLKDVLVDTGSSGELTLRKNKLTDQAFAKDSFMLLTGYASFGLLGGHMDTTRYFKSSNIYAENIRFDQHTINVSKRSHYLLGNGIFSDYGMYIDFRKKNLYLKQVVFKDENTAPKKHFGCSLNYDSKDTLCYIGSLLENSSADRAGLQLNDTILEINNEKLPRFIDYCEFMEWHEKLHDQDVLTIKIGRKEEEVRLEKTIVPVRR